MNELDIRKLINKHLGDGESHPNTWERVNEIRECLTSKDSNSRWSDTSEENWNELAEELWEVVSKYQLDKTLNLKRTDYFGHTPLENLLHCIDIPRYPPLEVLASIAEAFQIYMEAKGKLTLEDVFFGPLKKGVGNYSARKSKPEIYNQFDTFRWLRGYDKGGSLEHIASEYLGYGENPVGKAMIGEEPKYENEDDTASFLRGYRRWLKAGMPLSWVDMSGDLNDPDNKGG